MLCMEIDLVVIMFDYKQDLSECRENIALRI